VTTVIDMPCTSIPPVTDGASLRLKLAVVAPRAHVDFAFYAGGSANLLGEGDWKDRMAEASAAGAVGFKAYLLSGMDTFAALDEAQLEAVMIHAAALGRPVALHAEDPATVRRQTAALRAAGRADWAAVADARADPAEVRGVETGLRVAERTGCPLHVVHVGSGAAAARIGEAKRRGLDVTAETCPHFLAFTRDDFETLGPYLKTAPVVKTAADREALWAALADRTIDFVATDHAPCPRAEKETGDPWDAYGGVTGAETMLPFLWSEGVAAGRLSPRRLVDVTSASAARRWGLAARKGSLEPGHDADLVLLDPHGSWTVRGEDLQTKARWSPFDGRTFRGRVVRTFVRGRLVFDLAAGLPLEPGWGTFVPRGR
jgi:dihydroorotase (multifunctional complex type)